MRKACLLLVALLVLQAVTPAWALDQKDSGVYAIVGADNKITQKVLRVIKKGQTWAVEDRIADGVWKDVTCGRDCVLKESSLDDITHFFEALDLDADDVRCMHNKAFAFCALINVALTEQRRHLLIALTTPKPVAIRLQRIGEIE